MTLQSVLEVFCYLQHFHEPCQPTLSVYRPFHSTETAVLSVHNDLVRAIDDWHVSQARKSHSCVREAHRSFPRVRRRHRRQQLTRLSSR